MKFKNYTLGFTLHPKQREIEKAFKRIFYRHQKYFIVLSLFLLIFVSFNTVQADEPEWYNSDLFFMRKIFISNGIAGYEMDLNVSYNGGGDVTCEGNCNKNFSDIRFIAKDNSTLLSQFMYKRVNGSYCNFTVKLPDTIVSDGFILMYYGDPDATPYSNLSQTFMAADFFDTDPGVVSHQLEGGQNAELWDCGLHFPETTSFRARFKLFISSAKTSTFGYGRTKIFNYNTSWEAVSTPLEIRMSVDTDHNGDVPGICVYNDNYNLLPDPGYVWIDYRRDDDSVWLYMNNTLIDSYSQTGRNTKVDAFIIELMSGNYDDDNDYVTYDAANKRLNFRADRGSNSRLVGFFDNITISNYSSVYPTVSSNSSQFIGVPTDFDFSVVDDSNINLTWTKNSNYTVIERNNVASWNIGEGTEIYNGTGEFYVDNIEVASGIYYRAWSYSTWNGNKGYSTYSASISNIQGAFIYVYNESNPSKELDNVDIFVKNKPGTNTFSVVNVSTPYIINTSSMPLGEDIAIQVSKTGYKTRTVYRDFFVATFDNISFYLPPEDDTDHYVLQVKDENSLPIEDALINISTYINTSDSYETVFAMFTDGNGEQSVDLIPDNLYMVTITHDDYIMSTSDWIPPEVVYSDDAFKTFVLDSQDTDYDDNIVYSDVITFEGNWSGDQATVNFSDSSDNTTSAVITVWEINGSTNLSSVYQTFTLSNFVDYSTSFSIDRNNSYWVVLDLEHDVFDSVSDSFFLTPVYIPSGLNESNLTGKTSKEEFENFFDNIFGDSTLEYSGIFGLFIMMACLFGFGTRNVGISILITGFLMLGFNVALNLELLSVSFCVIIIVFGILVQWSISRRSRYG